MKIKTKDLIKILPLEESFRTELLQKYESMSPEQKYPIIQLLWDTYDALFRLKVEENMQSAFLRAKNNQEKLDHSFYDRIKIQTEKQLEEENSKILENVDLSAARKAMEQIIAEIRASKKPSTSV